MPEPIKKAEGVAGKAKGGLTHKVGPLPLWGWAVAGVVAVFIAKKLGGGGGGGAAPGLVTIPSTGGSAGDSLTSGASPNLNAHGGTDTVTGGTPPWWASPPQGGSTPPPFVGATQGVPLAGQPSTNGSAGAGPATQTPTGAQTPAAQGGSWWSRLLNPSGGLPAGAAVTTIGGVTYSLSEEALARAGITGASAPPAGAAQPVGNTTSAPTAYTDPNGRPWVSQWGGVGAGPLVTWIRGVAPPPPKPGEAGYKGWAENNL